MLNFHVIATLKLELQDTKPGLISMHLANYRAPAYNFPFNGFIISGLPSKEQVFPDFCPLAVVI